MATKTATVPGAGVRTLHTNAGVTIDGAETDVTLAAGDTITFPNAGDCVLKIKATTGGTGTIVATNTANNVALTLPIGTVLIGPLDPGVFGSTVTINTATAAGTAALYRVTPRYNNPLHNPFETNPAALDS